MSQLAHLRQKIKSIQTTKKVTHAIRLVSMSLYSKLERQDATLKYYTKTVRELFCDHLQYAPEWNNPVLVPQDLFDTNPLFIIVSSSRGLCGSLNSNLFRYLESAVFLKDQKKVSFITVGTKAHKFIKESGWGEVICNYAELNTNNFITVADSLVEKIVNAPVHYSSVSLLGSERRSFFSQRPRKMTLIPLSLEKPQPTSGEQVPGDVTLGASQSHEEDEVIWEQQNEEILETLATGYLRCSLIDMLFQSLLAEYAARFLAMDNSTTNAEKYLEKLTLQYNKARQAAITKEVSELTAGCLGR